MTQLLARPQPLALRRPSVSVNGTVIPARGDHPRSPVPSRLIALGLLAAGGRGAGAA